MYLFCISCKKIVATIKVPTLLYSHLLYQYWNVLPGIMFKLIESKVLQISQLI